MNTRLFLPFFFILIVISLCVSAQDRKEISFNQGWKFSKGNIAKAQSTDFDDSKWESISLPHDWAIAGPFDKSLEGSQGKLPWKGEAWYRKSFSLNQTDKGKEFYLIFDGIMAFPQVYINGKLAGKWDYGYNSFYLKITDFVNFDTKNQIAIYVDTRQHGSRWYPGAGIYRKISMLMVNPIHVDIWGTFVSTPKVSEKEATVLIKTRVNNLTNQKDSVIIKSFVVSATGSSKEAMPVATTIQTMQSHEFEQSIIIPSPLLWDVEKPNLYQVKTFIEVKGQTVDEYSTTFGIRTFEFKGDDGFHLNGRRVQINGVNLHHDHGALGAAFYTRAMERQLEIMRDMGCNAIRTSHNMPAPELVQLCDKMGFLLFNEAFDKWDNKADILENTNFDEFMDRQLRNFVWRDRNSPSVIIWSVGNEMGDIQWNINNGFQKLQKTVEIYRKYDPTRPITMVCDSKNSAYYRHFDYYDVQNWNYGRRYLPARNLAPHKACMISESASTVSTRGFYDLNLPKNKLDFSYKSGQLSSYDLNAPDWAEISDDDFMWQEEDTYIAGEFVWTGFDYLGEPTPYWEGAVKAGLISNAETARSSFFGIVDLCGIPKDRYYLYRSKWNTTSNTIHILPHWNWEKGQNVPVFVYTNGDEAELFLNGNSLGKRRKLSQSKNSTERYRLMWNEVAYQPGEIKAVAYKNGKIIGEKIIKTAGKPAQIKLTPDRSTIQANGEDLSYVLVEALDQNGNVCPLAENMIQFQIKGNAEIAGVDNGNPQSYEPFQADYRRLFYGKAMLIVRSKDGAKGKIDITAESRGLKAAKIQLTAE